MKYEKMEKTIKERRLETFNTGDIVYCPAANQHYIISKNGLENAVFCLDAKGLIVSFQDFAYADNVFILIDYPLKISN